MLWLALYFPRLAIEIYPPQSPCVAVEKDRICALDTAAAEAGIEHGMRLASALGLSPGLIVYQRDIVRETQALDALACWAGNFTPQVSVVSPDSLLLEIGGCLRLFGGLPALHRQVLAGCAEQGWSVQAAVAPTPLAAYWLALAGEDAMVQTSHAIATVLAPLPIEVLKFNDNEINRLSSFGVRELGDVFRLPRDGLARRFGPQLPTLLARALGEIPDPRPWFVFPECFAQRIELPAPVDNTQALFFVARRLVLALSGWLSARASGIDTCRLVLRHHDQTTTEVTLKMAGYTRDAKRIERILRERLDRLQLAAPVETCVLIADAAQALPGSTDSLFGEVAVEALAPLIERLRARLGEDKVGGLAAVADYRPECATAMQMQGRACMPHSHDRQRPLWLLPQARTLPEVNGRPHHAGPLQLLAGPERIESGWWDEDEIHDTHSACGDVRRDYFVALSSRGEWMWIYRDGAGWHWQGIFS
ncbi:MAG TPA: DNA polymerase Y family protein [Rhodocyclaceae bacterium]|nr:DNA polymerase Y family protein [Rhodocyclaceae bacterium]